MKFGQTLEALRQLFPDELFRGAPWIPFEELDCAITYLAAIENSLMDRVAGAAQLTVEDILVSVARHLKRVDEFFIKQGTSLVRWNMLKIRPSLLNKLVLSFTRDKPGKTTAPASWFVAYAKLNSTAFRKLMKKLDRKMRTKSGFDFRARVFLPTSFLSGPLLMAVEAIASMEEPSAILQGVHVDIETHGDEANGDDTPIPRSRRVSGNAHPSPSSTTPENSRSNHAAAAPSSPRRDAPPPDTPPPASSARRKSSTYTRRGSRGASPDRPPPPSPPLDRGSLPAPVRELLEVVEEARMEVLTCPICLDVLYRTVALACGHVFCLECALRCAGLRNAKGTLNNVLANVHPRSTCPQCHQVGVFDRALVRTMPEVEALVKRHFPAEWDERHRAAGKSDTFVLYRTELNETSPGIWPEGHVADGIHAASSSQPLGLAIPCLAPSRGDLTADLAQVEAAVAVAAAHVRTRPPQHPNPNPNPGSGSGPSLTASPVRPPPQGQHGPSTPPGPAASGPSATATPPVAAR